MTIQIPGHLWQRLGELIAAQTGLHFSSDRLDDLKRGVESAGRELGLSRLAEAIEAFTQEPLDQDKLKVLAKHLTIGETYFFRDPKVFETLETKILPPLIHQRRQNERRLRIWSAGCCSGEEPYSIAILLHKLLPDIARWNITILATDINTRFLQKAEAGVFSKWSFRGPISEDLKKAYFKAIDENRFELLQAYKSLVTFEFLNLGEDSYPSLLTNTNAMDLILCRNVLMYFSPTQAAKVVKKLQRSLLEGGWLVTGTAETGSLFEPLLAVNYPGVAIFQKVTEPIREQKPVSKRIQAKPISFAPQPTKAAMVPRPNADELIKAARANANEGHFAAALELCDKALKLDKLNAGAHYLKGSILQEQNQLDDAVASLRRVLYLDREFVLAYFTLGMIMQQKGNMREQAKHFQNALLLLQKYTPNEVIPGSGMTAGRLADVIKSTIHVREVSETK